MSQSERVTGVLQFVASDRREYHNHKQCEKVLQSKERVLECHNQGEWQDGESQSKSMSDGVTIKGGGG